MESPDNKNPDEKHPDEKHPVDKIRRNGNHRGRTRRRLLAAPLVIIAAGGVAACGESRGTIVMGAATTTSRSVPILGVVPTSRHAIGLPTTSVAPSSTVVASSTAVPPTLVRTK